MLYIERASPITDTVFWCGHREFDEEGNSDIGTTDFVVLMAVGIFIVSCSVCFLKLANVVLEEGIFLPAGAGPVSYWCKHRDWLDGTGQPAEGDQTFEIIQNEDAYLVACPDCTLLFGMRLAEKAIRLKFEDVTILENLIASE